MSVEHVEIALETVGKDMGGVFAAVIIIMAAVMIPGCTTKNRKNHKDGKEQESMR